MNPLNVLLALHALATPSATPADPAATSPTVPAQVSESSPRPHRLPTVQVTATHGETTADAVAAAVTVLPGDPARLGGPGVNLSERLAGVPGLIARDRQNQAQDLQVSIRGFGSRSTFGIRGIRLLQDGFPASMPDGQGQLSNIDLGSLGRIEVLRGPFSALYGNAAGGVIQVFTAPGADDPGIRIGAALTADNGLRSSVNLRGLQGPLDYDLDAMRFQTDGFRGHGYAERSVFNGRLAFALPGAGELRLVANALNSPIAEDPLGLDDVQWRNHPREAAPASLQFNTRKSLQHALVGVDIQRPFGAHQELRLLGYGGTRAVRQFLAVPVAAQRNPLSGGGVIDLDSQFSGGEFRWRWQGMLADGPLVATLGLSRESQRQHRRGYENFVGAILGVQGALRRDQLDDVGSFDQYAQLDWHPQARLGLLLGLRHSRVRFQSNDRYVTSGNPDDSGSRTFPATTPVLGVTYELSPESTVYLSMGRGFETPTADELAYRSDGSSGLNFGLHASDTRSIELGARSRGSQVLRWQAALFRADSNQELVVASSVGGRSSFQNAGRARRQGLELSAQADVTQAWSLELAYTLLDARFRDAFLACATSPCSQPGLRVPEGSALPGLPRQQAFVALRWQQSAWSLDLSAQAVSSVPVASTSSMRAPGYLSLDAELGHVWKWRASSLATTLRLGNALDRRYVGSVIVNEANGRFYEPAPGRNLMLVIDWRP